VLVEHVPGGASRVAVVDRDWLNAALRALGTRGIRPTRLLVETDLALQLVANEMLHPWLVVRSSRGGFACLGQGEVIALDLADDPGTVPLALRVARNTHRRRGEVPGEILVFGTPGTDPPALDAWSRLLEVPDRHGGEWRPELVDGRALRGTDLLRGDFAANSQAGGLSRTLMFAGVAAGIVCAAHALLTFGDWWRLSAETRDLRARMEAQFREIFPDAKVVVDPPLQMQRGLARLRQEAGVPDSSDFVPLLAAVGPVLAEVGLNAERLRYDRGALELQVSFPVGEEPDALLKQLAVPGYRLRVERPGTGPSAESALLVVSTEG
jgi:general secretion pathway protein L